MTEPTTTPAEATPTTSEEPAEQPSEAPPEASSANREAARYRTKLREAESRLAAVQERITAIQRTQIEAYAAKQLAVGADLFDVGGAALDDLLHENGEADLHAVDAAITALLEKRPGLRSNEAPWGEVQGGSEIAERGPTMHDALRFTGR
ncbi:MULTISPECIES: hypothetical protein [unclassified Streptomyces]|uniref:hypothetical protein n=1 Tax=unclassified Streptomyces TaxID=2593676 RepID=UPI0030788FED